jgi:hypothetical protein
MRLDEFLISRIGNAVDIISMLRDSPFVYTTKMMVELN